MLHRIDACNAAVAPSQRRTAAAPGGGSFAAVFSGQLEAQKAIRLSAHAEQRLSSRGIALSTEQQDRIASAVAQAAAKGARDSLVLMDGLALVVNVPNRTVITALPAHEAESTVFTQIDSAVVAPGAPSRKNETATSGPAPLVGGPAAADRRTRPHFEEILRHG